MNNTDAWSLYWQGSHQESCIANKGFEDQKILSDIWHELALSIDPNCTILDLATGNGSVPNSLLKFSEKFKITGVDYANINPKKYIEKNSLLDLVDFIPNIDITTLPFVDNQFDIITSQFGLEYSMLDISIHEFVRVLKPKGKFFFVMHHTKSEIVAPAHNKIKEFNFLRKSDLLILFEAFLNGTKSLNELDLLGQKIVEDLSVNKSQEVTGQIFNAINKLIELKRQGEDISKLNQYFSDMKLRFYAEQSRLQQLISASLSESEMKALSNTLENIGTIVTFQAIILPDSVDVLGWKVSGMKL